MKLWKRFLVLCVLILSAAVLSPALAADDSLYHELGGEAGIKKISDSVLDRIYGDERIAFFFEGVDLNDQQMTLADFFCELSGGPCVYHGLSMHDVHSGLDIKHSEFDAFIEDNILGMNDAGIPHRIQNKLLARMARLRSDIILK